MSKDLALSNKGRKGGLARGGEGGGSPTPPAPNPGVGISTSSVSFTAKGYTYDTDMPKSFRQGAAKDASTALALREKKGKSGGGALALYDKNAPKPVAPRSPEEMAKIESQVIASGVRQLDKPRRSNGRIVQRRVGWQATPTSLLITTAERALEKSGDGKMRPAGQWEVEHRKTYRNLDGEAKKRVGDVLADDAEPTPAPTVQAATPSDTQQAPPTPSPAPAQDAFPEGVFALSFLPRSVRSSVLARVPEPTVFDGTALQFSHPETKAVDRLEVNVIRMDEKRAVVVQARRAPGGQHWTVSQASYSLGEPEVEQV